MIIIRFLIEILFVCMVFQYIVFAMALQDGCMKRHQFWLMFVPFGWIVIFFIWAFKQQFGKD